MLGIRPEMILAREGVRVATKTSARRCLFGPVDHDDLKKTIRKEMLALDTENKSKYNFDFSKEEPLDGAFKWTPVKDTESVPIAYKMQDFQNLSILADYSKFLNMGSICDSEPEPKQQIKTRRILKPRLRRNVSGMPQISKAAPATPTETVRRALKRKQQRQITEFFPTRKLARTEKSSQ